MSDISDPGRAGRGDRKRAQKLIDAAYAAGQLTAADRAFRTERVDSAHTKGDLAVLVRDLVRAGGAAAAAGVVHPPTTSPSEPIDPTSGRSTTSLGSAIPPDQLKSMMKGGSASTIRVGESMRAAMTGDNVKRVRRIVLIVVVGFLLLCGLSLAGIVAAIFTGIDQGSDPADTPATSVNLQTADGWSQLVAAIENETGTSEVYDVVVYPEYASINAVADEGAMRYVYRGGSFQLFNSPVTPALGDPIDLAEIDADLVAGLPDQTAERQGMPEYDSAYLIVNTLTGSPAIMVYVQQTGRLSRWSIYALDGTVIGGSPD